MYPAAGDDFQTFNGGHHRNSGSNDDFTIEKLPPISPIITSIDVVRADVLRPASDINVRIPFTGVICPHHEGEIFNGNHKD